MAISVPRTAVVLPVKRLDDAKQRLGVLLTPPQRRALMAAMLDDVLHSLGRVAVSHELLVVTRDADAARAAQAHGARVIADPADAGHSAAAALGIDAALAHDAERVLLVPGDCPLLASEELDGLLRLAPAPHGRVVVVADREGEGTNALLLEPPGVIRPAFGPGSHARHLAAAKRAGVPVLTRRPASLLLDVDTPADLRALADALVARPDAAPRTAAVLAGMPLAVPAAR